MSNHEPGAATGYFDDDKSALHHTDVDRNELHDLSEQHRDIARRLEARWWVEAGKYNVLPFDDRREIRGSGRPSPLRDRKQFSFYAGPAAVPQWAAVRLFNRSYDMSTHIGVPPAGVEGVIFSQGGRVGGHALFVLDGRLTYVHNFLGLAEYSVDAEAPLPEGDVSLRFSFEKTGDNCGTGTLWANGVELARADIPRTVPIRFDAEGVVTVGRAEGFPVSSRYRTAFTFTGGLSRVDIDVHGEAASLSAAAQLAGLAEQ